VPGQGLGQLGMDPGLPQAVKVMARIIRWYNEERLHSALGFLRPVDYYRGNPEELYAARRQKLAAARHRRREKNLQLRQLTLPLTSEETVAWPALVLVPDPLKQNKNAAVCTALLEDLCARGLDTSSPTLLVLDGVKALHAAAKRVWG